MQTKEKQKANGAKTVLQDMYNGGRPFQLRHAGFCTRTSKPVEGISHSRVGLTPTRVRLGVRTGERF